MLGTTASPKIDKSTHTHKITDNIMKESEMNGTNITLGKSPNASHPASMIDPAISSLL